MKLYIPILIALTSITLALSISATLSLAIAKFLAAILIAYTLDAVLSTFIERIELWASATRINGIINIKESESF